MSSRLWQNLWVRLAVALAFADASIVVLALPQLVDRFHTSISRVVWVIVAYNLALIAASVVVLPLASRLASRRALVAGLALFGLSSIGCGASNSLSALIPLRCAQGVGGALVLCASLPLFGEAARAGDSPLYGWSAAAAIGAAVGPAAGGILTQVFSWRSIFFAQAPVAAIAAFAVIATPPSPRVIDESVNRPAGETRPALDPLSANVALTFLSAGLIGALFLVVIELINAWLVSPIGAAAVVTTIPLSTAVAERVVRGRSPLVLATIGALLVAAGLACLGLVTHRELGIVVPALALCGAGLGLGFPGLTTVALRSRGPETARAAKTIAARDAGLVLGLLVLTPVFVDQINATTVSATKQAAAAVIVSPLPTAMKFQLAPGLQAAAANAPQSRPPDIGPVFARAIAGAPAQRTELTALEKTLNAIIQRGATHAFKRPFLYGALFALVVLPLLLARVFFYRRLSAARSAA